jgi:hypothetical protein
MNYFKKTVFFFFVFFLISCERDVTIDLPDTDGRMIIEAKIEEGMPPIVILSKSIGYFKATDQSTYESLFIRGASVNISSDNGTITLTEICSRSFPDSLLPLLASFLGVDVNMLAAVNFCVYSTLNPAYWGQVGKTYKLSVIHQAQEYTATSTIPQNVYLDSLWFELYGGSDSLGFLWARINEPPGLGNAYRWYAMRLGKDNSFIAPYGSVFDDKFIDGLNFKFAYNRGAMPNSTAEDDNNAEAGYFKKGDTVLVKFCSLDYPTFLFLRTFEAEIVNNGNPFASPTTIQSNISGGAIGYWGAYSFKIDTVICK